MTTEITILQFAVHLEQVVTYPTQKLHELGLFLVCEPGEDLLPDLLIPLADAGFDCTPGFGEIDAGNSLILGVRSPLDEPCQLHALQHLGDGGRLAVQSGGQIGLCAALLFP